jgi:hypothetical protein
MSDWIDYDFAVVQVVPHVHRYGSLSVGVVLHARTAEFLDARIMRGIEELRGHVRGIEHQRLERLARYLESYCAIARGDASAGRLGLLPPSERFHWLTAPRSDLIQCSPIHGGRTRDPRATLDALYGEYVGD